MENDLNFSYLAGFFEGEGSVIISRAKRCNGGYSYSPCLCVANTDKIPLNLFLNVFGGGIYEKYRPSEKENWNPCFEWRLFSKELIINCLTTLLPYFKFKNNQVEVILKFFTTVSVNSGNRVLTKEEQNKLREDCYNQLKTIHNRRQAHV